MSCSAAAWTLAPVLRFSGRFDGETMETLIDEGARLVIGYLKGSNGEVR